MAGAKCEIPSGTVGTVTGRDKIEDKYEVEFTIGDSFESHWHATALVRKADLEKV
jgi:hypothetical protein